MKMKDKTIVVFRWWDGEVIALFPEIADTYNGYTCQSFMHVGQHGGADYHSIITMSRPATPEEFSDLKQELESTPYEYDLEIRKKISFKIHRARLERGNTECLTV